MAKWKKETIWIATTRGPLQRDAITYRGVGLFYDPPFWSVTHINSGLAIRRLRCRKDEALRHAKAIAELTDWGAFTMPDNWMQTDPGLMERLKRLALPVAPMDDRPGDHDAVRRLIAVRGD
jgi:hypothetical protein